MALFNSYAESADAPRGKAQDKMRETAQQLAECFNYFDNTGHLLKPGEKHALAQAVCATLERSVVLHGGLADLPGGPTSTTEIGSPISPPSDDRGESVRRDFVLHLAREVLNTPAEESAFDQLFVRLHRSFLREFKVRGG